jgi:hypothetical protein
MLKLLNHLTLLFNLLFFPSYFGFFRTTRVSDSVSKAFLFACETAVRPKKHKQTNISDYLQLTGKNKFIG